MEPSELLRRLVAVLDESEIPYRVVGSVAAMTYGEPRFTNDIDVVVPPEAGAGRPVLQLLSSRGILLLSRCDHRGDSESAVNSTSSITSRASRSTSSFRDTGLESHVTFLARGRRVVLMPGFEAWFASPEDVILKKLEYFREGGSEKHVGDIAGILKVQQERIDRDYIAVSARRLGLEAVWLDVLQRLEHP